MAGSSLPRIAVSGIYGLFLIGCVFDPSGILYTKTGDGGSPVDAPLASDAAPTNDASTADAAPPPDGPYPDCWTNPNYDQVEPATGHRYYLFTDTQSQSRRSWSAARSICEGDGAHLVVIDNDVENAFVRSLLDIGRMWIGLHDQNTEGKFEWVTGASFSYQNWALSEPNNHNDQDCHEMYTNGEWNDSYCGYYNDRRFVCECDPAYTP